MKREIEVKIPMIEPLKTPNATMSGQWNVTDLYAKVQEIISVLNALTEKQEEPIGKQCKDGNPDCVCGGELEEKHTYKPEGEEECTWCGKSDWHGSNPQGAPYCTACGYAKDYPKPIRKPEEKEWEPIKGDNYYFIDALGIIDQRIWGNHTNDDGRQSFGNIFKTRAEAEIARDKIKELLNNFKK